MRCLLLVAIVLVLFELCIMHGLLKRKQTFFFFEGEELEFIVHVVLKFCICLLPYSMDIHSPINKN